MIDVVALLTASSSVHRRRQRAIFTICPIGMGTGLKVTALGISVSLPDRLMVRGRTLEAR